MKYFTPDRYVRLQDFSSDAKMDAAGEDWERAARRYRRKLSRLLPELPSSLQSLVAKYCLHDAQVLTIGSKDCTFIIVLRLSGPPQQLLILNYELAGAPVILKGVLPPDHCAEQTQWLYDEIEHVSGNKDVWVHSILLSNGWEVRLPLRNLRLNQSEALYPTSGIGVVPVAESSVSQSA